MRALAIIVLACVVVCPTFAGAEETTTSPGGFGAYRLGMTVADARAVDPALRELEGGGLGYARLRASSGAQLGNFTFPVHLNFRDERLSRIALEAAGSVQSHDQCAAIFTHVLTSLEASYGALAGASAPSEYGNPLPVRTSARGSIVRSYEFGQQQLLHANQRGRQWLELIGYVGPHPDVPAGALFCKISVDIREHGPLPLSQLIPPTPEQLAAARAVEPVWEEQPNSDVFEMTLPQYAPEGRVEVDVELDCLVIEGGRLNCVVVSERPLNQFFGEFALRLARNFRAQPTSGRQSILGGRARVPVTLILNGPGAPDERAASDQSDGGVAASVDMDALRALAARAPSRAILDAAPLIERAEWIETPDGSDFARYYPTNALERGTGGRVVLECIVASEGRLQCAVLEEEPANNDFGLAALGIAQSFRMAEQIDGLPTAGKRIRVPISFRTE
jgi:TonB family protein